MINDDEILDPGIVEAMGISRPAFEEVVGIIGRMLNNRISIQVVNR